MKMHAYIYPYAYTLHTSSEAIVECLLSYIFRGMREDVFIELLVAFQDANEKSAHR